MRCFLKSQNSFWKSNRTRLRRQYENDILLKLSLSEYERLDRYQAVLPVHVSCLSHRDANKVTGEFEK